MVSKNSCVVFVYARHWFFQSKTKSGCPSNEKQPLRLMAEPTGLDPATSDVTGRRSNQLNYDSALRHRRFSIADCRLINSLIGNWKLTIGMSGGRGGTRTPNLFLVREAVYH